MEKINVAELLKDCPSGMELDCTMYDDIFFYEITDDPIFPILVKRIDGSPFTLTKYGEYANCPSSKCVIFPKGKTTWEGFVPPCKFKDGDIISSTLFDSVCIFRGEGKIKGTVDFYCGINTNSTVYNELFIKDCKDPLEHFGDIIQYNFASAEEKQKLFQAIKDKGYKWNSKTKTLEKLIDPKFKVGDKIAKCGYRFTITEVKGYYYLTKCGNKIPIDNQDDFNLVPNKFDINTLVPFESKVLVRNDESQYWIPAFWGCKRNDGYTTTFGWCKYCIPYEGNEYLLETNNDCDEFFKTWK